MENGENRREVPEQEISDLLFGVRRSIRYHYRRCAFFENQHKLYTALSALGGSAVIVAVLANAGPGMSAAFAAVVAIASAINLVFDISRNARRHHDFTKQFIALEKVIVGCRTWTSETYAQLLSARLDIEAEEPPPLRILNMICHNELVRALGFGDCNQVEIKWYQRAAAQFLDINDHACKLRSPAAI